MGATDDILYRVFIMTLEKRVRNWYKVQSSGSIYSFSLVAS